MRLFKKRRIWLPTWPVVLLVFVGSLLLAGIVFFNSHSFLAVNKPAPEAKVLVAASWMIDSSIAKVAEMMNAEGSPYESIWLTGPLLDRGLYLSDSYKSFSDLAADTLRELGVAADKIHLAPPDSTERHRTHTSATNLKAELDSRGLALERFDLVTVDVHARRSRLVYQKVFEDSEVGVISLPSSAYDEKTWYRTSNGMKNVIFEIVAYLYEKLANDGR